MPTRLAHPSLLLFALLALILSACAREPEPAATPTPAAPSAARPKIVVTTGMVGDIVARVAGPGADVQVLMGPGIDPHLYKPTRADIARLNDADIVFFSGLLLEGKMTETFDRLRASGKRVHALADAVGAGELLAWEDDAPAEPSGAPVKHHDPHLWMDPVLWARTIDVVESRLAALDPARASDYAANAKALRAELAALHDYAVKSLATVPEPARVLITAHDAFGYFGRRYSYRVEGVQGISTETEAGVKDIQRLVDLIVDRKVKAVFVESSVSARNVEALIAGCKARNHAVAIGGELFSDAMGPANTYEGTYTGMLDHNITTITRALGGQAPERGMQGKLKP